jgi:predicted ferric reductase
MIGLIITSVTILLITINTALSLLYTFSQFNVTYALGSSAFTSNLLVTELNSLTVTKSSNHTLSLHRLTSISSSTMNFPGYLLPTIEPVAPMVFKITPLHGPHGKRGLLLLRMRVYSFVA